MSSAFDPIDTAPQQHAHAPPERSEFIGRAASQRRIAIAFAVLFAIAALLLVRAADLQLVHGRALASAAAWLVEALPSLDEKTCREVAWFWPDAPSERDIEWALSVKYDAAKPRWYSLRDRKVSASTSKANDRRWEKVPEWCDGSVKSASTLLRPDDGGVGDLLRAWVRYDAVCAFASRVDPSVYYEQPQEFFREVIGEQPSVWSAFEAARCAFNAARQLHAARGQLATYKFNTASENSPTTSPTAQEGAP